MSSSKPLKSKKKHQENTKESFVDSSTAEPDSNHEDSKRSRRSSKEKSPKDVHKVSKKPFVIPRKTKQAKGLLCDHTVLNNF